MKRGVIFYVPFFWKNENGEEEMVKM